MVLRILAFGSRLGLWELLCEPISAECLDLVVVHCLILSSDGSEEQLSCDCHQQHSCFSIQQESACCLCHSTDSSAFTMDC